MKSKRKPNLVTREPKLSRNRAPGDLSVQDWQRGLRRQFGREQAFGLENLGKRGVLFRFPGQQSGVEVELSSGDPGAWTGWKFLFVPGLRHQRAGDLQAP